MARGLLIDRDTVMLPGNTLLIRKHLLFISVVKPRLNAEAVLKTELFTCECVYYITLHYITLRYITLLTCSIKIW